MALNNNGNMIHPLSYCNMSLVTQALNHKIYIASKSIHYNDSTLLVSQSWQ